MELQKLWKQHIDFQAVKKEQAALAATLKRGHQEHNRAVKLATTKAERLQRLAVKASEKAAEAKEAALKEAARAQERISVVDGAPDSGRSSSTISHRRESTASRASSVAGAPSGCDESSGPNGRASTRDEIDRIRAEAHRKQRALSTTVRTKKPNTQVCMADK